MNKKFWLAVALLFAVGFAVFGNSLNGGFVYDDNLVLSHIFFGKFSDALGFLTQPYFEDFPEAGLYRPLTQISFTFNFLFGRSPFSFHLTNILLHVFNSALVFLLVRDFGKTFRLALFASLLFLVLPAHVESVSSIVGRAELLSFLFFLLALLLWLKSGFFWSSIAFFFALLSKETAIVLPAVLLVLTFYLKGRPRWIVYYAIAILAYFVLRIKALGPFVLNPQVELIFNPLKFASFWERIFTALKILSLYVQKVFAPFNLSADYSYNQIGIIGNILTSPVSLFGLLLLISILFVSIWFLRKRQNLFLVFAAIVFLFSWLIISNLILPIGTIMADRLMYMPSLGLTLFAVLFFDFLLRRWGAGRAALPIFAVVIIFYSLTSIGRSSVWANEEKLFGDMYKKSPDSAVAKTYWSRSLLDRGKLNEVKKIAAEAYDLYPNFIPNLNLSAEIEKRSGNLKKAEFYLEKAWLLRPSNQETLLNLSRVYFVQKKYGQTAHILEILVPRYGGKGNTLLLIVSWVKAGDYKRGKDVVLRYFGEKPQDELAAAVLDYTNLHLGALAELKEDYDKKEIERRFIEIGSFFEN